MATNQQITFLADGGEDIRELPRFLNPNSEHLLDWFHVTMRLTVIPRGGHRRIWPSAGISGVPGRARSPPARGDCDGSATATRPAADPSRHCPVRGSRRPRRPTLDCLTGPADPVPSRQHPRGPPAV